MKNETLIHVGFQYDEAVKAKRDLLSLEMNLLEATKAMTNYHSLRSEELKFKLKLYLRIKEYMSLLKKLKRLLPAYQRPRILKEIESEEFDIERIKEDQEVKYGSHVDSQLEELRDKLKTLQ
jgi:hypothetical protein